MTTLPAKLPVLTAKDIYRGSFHSPSGKTHCLLGWAGIAIPDDGERMAFIERAQRAMYDLLPNHLSLMSINDVEPKCVSASFWNDACRAMKYARRGKWWVLPKRKAVRR